MRVMSLNIAYPICWCAPLLNILSSNLSNVRHVRFWHLADMSLTARMSAFEGKADIKVGPRRGELARTARGRLQRVRKISGASAADHLGDAWQASLAADDAVGTRTSVAIGRAVVSSCVLRESPADFLADAFDLLGGVLTEGYISSVRRDVEAKSAN